MNTHTLSLLSVIALLAAGCTMVPEYRRPDAPVPAQWPADPATPPPPAPAGSPAATNLEWRSFYTDPKLSQVIELALANSRDLRLAAQNVEQARALYGVQRAQLAPVVDATAEGGRSQASGDLVRPGEPRTTDRYAVNLGVAAWEIDLFGRIRSLKEQALEEYLAAEETRRGAQLALVAEVARAYLALAADQESLALTRSTLKSRTTSHDLIQKQYDVGVVDELDLRRSRLQVDTARREVARFAQQVARDRNALNLLAGAQVPDALLPADLAGIAPPVSITTAVTSDVLLQRPDVMAAEHQLKSANALIGAARAAFFPRISLTTAVGTASDELSGLFATGSDTWNFTPRIVLPVFDARVWAARRVSQSVRDLAVTRYERTLQIAFREVADVLAEQVTLEEEISAQQAVVASAQDIQRLAWQRYDHGIDSYLSVLEAERSLFLSQQGLVLLRLARLANAVRTYAVLGGGGI